MRTVIAEKQDVGRLTSAQQRFRSRILNPILFRFFLLKELPMAFLAGIRMKELSRGRSTATITFRWLTQNPFRSTYFACLSMAAEMVQGTAILMAAHGIKPTVSTLPVAMECEFIKKATGTTTFTCEDGVKLFDAVEAAIRTKEALTVRALSIGKNEEGEEVCRFTFTWAVKQKST